MKLSDQALEFWIAKANEVLHSVFPDGSRAIVHATRIALRVELRLKPIALLHDVVEDTSTTIEDLRAMGFPTYILDGVDILTHRDNEPNMVYWGRIKKNPDTKAVKVVDIDDNQNDNPSEHAKQKYVKALAFLNSP